MNKFALLTLFLILFLSTKAQDRIISLNYDTIHCPIISINNKHIMFEQKNKDGSVSDKFMNVSQIAEYTPSLQPENNSIPRKLKTSKPVNVPEKVWCLGLKIGGSIMPWYFDNNSSSAAKLDYYNKLKTGFHINTSAHYMISSTFGVGAEYSFLNTNSGGSMETPYSTSMFLITSEKYHQYINYLGPSVLLVQYPDVRRKFILSESLSAGVLSFRLEDQSTYPIVDNSGYIDASNNSLFTGNALSAKFGLTFEYRLYRNVSVGLGVDYQWALLKTVDFESRGSNSSSSSRENQELTNAMNLSRIDYSFVLHYHF